MSIFRIIRSLIALAVLGVLVFGLPGSGQAITFDTDLHSSSTGAYRLGLLPGEWRTINEVIHFYSSSSVGIGWAYNPPMARLEVDQGLRLAPTGDKPNCDATVRGTLWYTANKAPIVDTLEVCRQSSGAYAWSEITVT